jgi:hypothetical protein
MAFLVAQATTELVQAGPFVDRVDGVTLLTGLTILPAQRLLSVNGGAFAPTTDLNPAVSLLDGYYSFSLTPADLGTLGTTRLSITAPGALPVWFDVLTVPPDVRTTLGPVASVPLLLHAQTVVLTMGPFVSTLDGFTLQSGLTIAPGNVRLSSRDGTYTASTSLTNAVPLGQGHYAVTLTSADLAVVGELRVSIALPGSLPVWLDVAVVSPRTWQLYFHGVFPQPPPVIAPTPSPTVVAPPIGTFGTRHFILEKHVAFIQSHGANVWVSPHLNCPCLLDSGQPTPLCPSCDGSGRLYPPSLAYASVMLLTQDSPIHSLQETGFWTAGTIRATLLPGIELAYQDYVRQVDVKTTFADELLTKGIDDTLSFRYGVEVFVVADRTRIYRPGVDYTFSAPQSIAWVPGGQAPALGERYSVRYRAYPEYLISPETPGLRIEARRAMSRVVTLQLLEKLSAAPMLAS